MLTSRWPRAGRKALHPDLQAVLAREPVSETARFMLCASLAKPIFIRALAKPIMRTTSPIGPFCRAKTCSTAARTFDFSPLAQATFLAIGLLGDFMQWMRERKPWAARCASLAFDHLIVQRASRSHLERAWPSRRRARGRPSAPPYRLAYCAAWVRPPRSRRRSAHPSPGSRRPAGLCRRPRTALRWRASAQSRRG